MSTVDSRYITREITRWLHERGITATVRTRREGGDGFRTTLDGDNPEAIFTAALYYPARIRMTPNGRRVVITQPAPSVRHSTPVGRACHGRAT